MIKVSSLISLLEKNNSRFFTGVPDSVLKGLSSYLQNKDKKTWKELQLNPKGLTNDTFSDLQFPGGTFFIDKSTNFLINKSTGVLVNERDLNKFINAHPIFLFTSTLRGSGASIQDIFDLLDYDVNNGPMLGQCNMSFDSPIRIGQKYKIDGKIISLNEKDSKKLGKIKILDFILSLFDESQSQIASVNYVWILPVKDF